MDKAASFCSNDDKPEPQGFKKIDPERTQPPKLEARPSALSGLVAEEITMTVNGELIQGML